MNISLPKSACTLVGGIFPEEDYGISIIGF